jgi:molybdate transport system regulatory protein
MTTPTVRFRIDFGRDAAVGPGKIALLEHIERSGSLSQAARDLKMSYRRAWLLLDSLNNSFEGRLANTSIGGRKGGGACLTPLGRALILAYRRFEVTLQSQVQRRFNAFSCRLRQVPELSGKAPRVRLSAR